MEVCQQGVCDFKVARRVKENARATGSGGNALIDGLGACCDGFEGAQSGGAHGDDSATFLFRRVDGPGGFQADLKPLLVHDMGGQSFSFDWRKSGEADVEGKETDVNAAGTDFFQERLGEVQTGSG